LLVWIYSNFVRV